MEKIDFRSLAAKLKPRLRPQTYEHSLAVRQKAWELAPRFDADPQKAALAGLVHDCAKNVAAADYLPLALAAGLEVFPAERSYPKVLHQRIGALWAREIFGVDDAETLAAVERHTTANKIMNPLAKCVFVADYISEDREFPGVEELRSTAEDSPERAFPAVLEFKVREVARKGRTLHPWTVQAVERWLPALEKMILNGYARE